MVSQPHIGFWSTPCPASRTDSGDALTMGVSSARSLARRAPDNELYDRGWATRVFRPHSPTQSARRPQLARSLAAPLPLQTPSGLPARAASSSRQCRVSCGTDVRYPTST